MSAGGVLGLLIGASRCGYARSPAACCRRSGAMAAVVYSGRAIRVLSGRGTRARCADEQRGTQTMPDDEQKTAASSGKDNPDNAASKLRERRRSRRRHTVNVAGAIAQLPRHHREAAAQGRHRARSRPRSSSWPIRSSAAGDPSAAADVLVQRRPGLGVDVAAPRRAGPKRVKSPTTADAAAALPAGGQRRDWLIETDLVFIDPVGTGFSRAAKPELEARSSAARRATSSRSATSSGST